MYHEAQLIQGGVCVCNSFLLFFETRFLCVALARNKQTNNPEKYLHLKVVYQADHLSSMCKILSSFPNEGEQK